MNIKREYITRIGALALILALVIPCARPALSEGAFSAYVKSERAVIYLSAWLDTVLGSLKKKTVVTVLNHSGGVAKIKYQGKTGYARVSDLDAVANIAKTAVLNANAHVYTKPTLSSPNVKVRKGTQVYVLAVSGECAMIEKNGNVGYVHTKYLTYANSAAPETPQNPEVIYEQFQAQVTKAEAKVYASPSASAKRAGTLKKGVVVNVKAYSGNWALIELKGNTGFCTIDSLKRYTPDPYAYLVSSEYTNEQIIYMFLTREMGFNTAAACGALANIKYESGFRTGAVGDNGKSYGICQWFSTRFTRMKNYCAKHDYDYTTLAGQLWFLKYELETYYPMVNKYMRGSVENSEQGAYDAGWYWCYHFEGPANRSSVSVTRGNYARNTMWARYANN